MVRCVVHWPWARLGAKKRTSDGRLRARRSLLLQSTLAVHLNEFPIRRLGNFAALLVEAGASDRDSPDFDEMGLRLFAGWCRFQTADLLP